MKLFLKYFVIFFKLLCYNFCFYLKKFENTILGFSKVFLHIIFLELIYKD